VQTSRRWTIGYAILGPDRSESEYGRAAFAIVTASPRRAVFPESPIHVHPDTRVAGVVDAVGEGCTDWKAGERVGVG
jgi:hypothetical protein